ncbi:MAG: prephenate dehydrogenase/arogenate dehydrogenase family protein [Phycisphaeraceae bacterium]
MNADVKQMAILGTGLLGASLGLATKAAAAAGAARVAGHVAAGRVVGYARRQEPLDEALATGAIDVGTTRLDDALAGSDLVVAAVPLGQMEAVFHALGQALSGAAAHPVVTDVGSTKRSVLDAARKHLPRPELFVGSHPMAGSEQQGPVAARADLFTGKPCILTPDRDTDADALEMVLNLWQTLGMRLVCLSPDEHDQQTATISHLPHAMAAMLVAVTEDRGGWAIASTGFRDTTRLASSNPPMRADILIANRDAMRDALAAMRGRLDELDRLLQAGDRPTLLAWLEARRAARDAWDGPA